MSRENDLYGNAGINFFCDAIAIDITSRQQKESILVIAIAIRLQNGNQSCNATATNDATKQASKRPPLMRAQVMLSSILVPRAYDISGLRQESRALGATILK